MFWDFLRGYLLLTFRFPMGFLILRPACRGDRLFVVDFPFSPGLDPPARGGRLFVVDFLFSLGFLYPPRGFRSVTDSLVLTFCFSFMVSVPPVLVCSGDWVCRVGFSTPTFGATDSGGWVWLRPGGRACLTDGDRRLHFVPDGVANELLL